MAVNVGKTDIGTTTFTPTSVHSYACWVDNNTVVGKLTTLKFRQITGYADWGELYGVMKATGYLYRYDTTPPGYLRYVTKTPLTEFRNSTWRWGSLTFGTPPALQSGYTYYLVVQVSSCGHGSMRYEDLGGYDAVGGDFNSTPTGNTKDYILGDLIDFPIQYCIYGTVEYAFESGNKINSVSVSNIGSVNGVLIGGVESINDIE